MLRIDVDARRLQAEFNRLARAIPGAAARALNTTARAVQAVEKAEIARVFNSPTPYVKNSPRVWYARANVQPLQSEVRITGRAAKALEAEILGGPRQPKNYELAMRSAGVVPTGRYIVPGPGATLDRYGNLDGDILEGILNSLGLLSQQRRGRRMTRKRARAFNAASSYFIAMRAGTPIGIWARNGRNVAQILNFVRQPVYRRRFDFFGKGMAEVRRTLPVEIARQMQRIRGARP